MRPPNEASAKQVNAAAKKGADAYLKRIADAQKSVDADVAAAARKRVERLKEIGGVTMKGKFNNSKFGQLAKELKSFLIDEGKNFLSK